MQRCPEPASKELVGVVEGAVEGRQCLVQRRREAFVTNLEVFLLSSASHIENWRLIFKHVHT